MRQERERERERERITIKMRGSQDAMVPSRDGRDGTEHARPHQREVGRGQRQYSREKREEHRKKREGRDKHDEDERVEGGNGSVPEWRDGNERGRSLGKRRQERREKREERNKPPENGGMVQKRKGP